MMHERKHKCVCSGYVMFDVPSASVYSGSDGKGRQKAYDPLLNDGYGSGERGSLSPLSHLISPEIRVGDDRFM